MVPFRYRRTLRAAVRCWGPGFETYRDNFEAARAISGRERIANQVRDPVISGYSLRISGSGVLSNLQRTSVVIGVDTGLQSDIPNRSSSLRIKPSCNREMEWPSRIRRTPR